MMVTVFSPQTVRNGRDYTKAYSLCERVKPLESHVCNLRINGPFYLCPVIPENFGKIHLTEHGRTELLLCFSPLAPPFPHLVWKYTLKSPPISYVLSGHREMSPPSFPSVPCGPSQVYIHSLPYLSATCFPEWILGSLKVTGL